MFTLFAPDGSIYAMTRDVELASLLGNIMEEAFGQTIVTRYEPDRTYPNFTFTP